MLAILAAIFCMAHAADYYIDVILPITGGTEADNVMYQKAAEAAQQAATNVSASFAPDTITVNIRDSQNSGARALNLALASGQGTTHAVIGAGGQDHTESVASLLKNFDVALLSPFSHNPLPTELTNFYAVGPSLQSQVNALKAMLARYGWTKIAVAHTTEPDSLALLALVTSLPGIELVVPPLALSDESDRYLDAFDPFINASVNIYVIIIPRLSTLSNVISQCQISGGFFVGPKAFFYLNAPAEVSQPASRVIPQGGMIIRRTEGTPAGIAAFTAELGAAPTVGAPATYDAVMAVVAAIERGATTKLAIAAELANTASNGHSGPLSFTDGYRNVHTYSIVNIFNTVKVPRVAFNWDGTIKVAAGGAPAFWPGMATVPTLGNVTLWPVAFVSAQFTNTEEMLSTIGSLVPLNRTAHASFVRYAVKRVNDLYMPVDAKISTPPLNDNGTVQGAVRIGSTLASDNYIGIVGTWDSPNTKILQGILSAYSIPQFAYSAGDPTLSDKAAYPTLVRTWNSDREQILAVLSMIQNFGWNKVGVLSSTSQFGSVMDSTFTSELRKKGGIEQATSGVFLENFSDINTQLEALRDAKVNILVLLVDSNAYVRVKQAMIEIGYEPRAVIVPERFFSTLLWQHTLDGTGLTLADFKGWIGAAPNGGAGHAEFEALKADIITTVNTSAAYPSMLEGFLQAPDYCAYIYDSFHILGVAIKNCLAQGKSPRSSTDLLGCIREADVVLTTGRVAFDSNYDRLENHFVLRYMSPSGEPVTFGTWNDGTTGDQSVLSVNAAVVWPDGTTTVPLAEDPKLVKWLKWSSPAGIALAAIAAVGIAYCMGMLVLMIVWHESPLLISATYPFLVLILLGAALGFGSMFTWIGEPRSWICALRIWLPPMAFIIMLAPLLAKTWRLHRIFSLTTLKTTPIPLWKLIVLVSCLALIQVAICVAWISAGTIKVVTIDDKQNISEAYRICEQNNVNRICAYVTYAYLGLLMVIGAYYAFRVRNLPKDFNESRWIGFSIYNTLLFSVIIIILGYSLADFKVTVLILICVCTLAITFGVTSLMMAPKIWDLILHPDRRSSSTGNSGSHTTSGTRRGTSSNSFREGSMSKQPYRRHDYSVRPAGSKEMTEMRSASKGSRGYSKDQETPREPRNSSRKNNASSDSE
jgi:ABC-type branched-subunit amino acid transport system substrate-binding protein